MEGIRIQNGILWHHEEIVSYFKEAFIFLYPKDIVSGDFYWFAHKDDFLMIAAVDCTGHGIPGALMTMLGNELLNQIVNEQDILLPNQILNALDSKLFNAIQKKNCKSEVYDGMEIGLCTIDLKNRQLFFSGARRPLYQIRKGELNQLDGSLFSIGGKKKEKEKTFNLSIIDIEENDAFYLFSDGFQDQLSEEKKRFTSQQLRNFLIKSHYLGLQEQGVELRKIFENWRGNMNQTDDILGIGFKVF